MGLVFVYTYQHHDPHLLEPVARELLRRGHNVMSHPANFYAFLSATGPRALLLVADLHTNGHVEGRAAVKLARQNKIASVSIQHGCPAAFPNPEDPPTETSADVYCLWGEYWRRWFDSPAQAVTGNPALDVAGEHEKEKDSTALLAPCFREDARHKQLAGMDTMTRAMYYIDQANQRRFDGLWWQIRPHPSDLKRESHREALSVMVEEIPGAVLTPPHEYSLFDQLDRASIVMGTSTVVVEGMAFDCYPRPHFMEYLEGLDTYDLLGDLDGGAAERVANVVERRMYAAG